MLIDERRGEESEKERERKHSRGFGNKFMDTIRKQVSFLKYDIFETQKKCISKEQISEKSLTQPEVCCSCGPINAGTQRWAGVDDQEMI